MLPMTLLKWFHRHEMVASIDPGTGGDAVHSRITPMIANGEPGECDLIQRWLVMLGCQPERILTAGNGEDAVALFRRHPCDLIFMACHMPVMDGFQAARTIRAFERKHNSKSTPIIALSPDFSSLTRYRCCSSGMSDFLTKPFHQRGFGQIMEKWCLYSEQVVQ